MFRVITCNTNGIRAAQRKGFFEWLAKQDADVVCIQETKAQEHQLVDDAFRPDGYHCYYNDAERKGYSGTALYAKQKPSAIEVKVGWEPVDSEGRYLRADFDGISVISLYVPSGSSNDDAQARKDVFMERFTPHMAELLKEKRNSSSVPTGIPATRTSISKIGEATRKTRALCRTSVNGSLRFMRNRAGLMSFGR